MGIVLSIANWLTTRLFVALFAFGVVGWIILFGKNLPSRFNPIVLGIVAIAVVGAIYLRFAKPALLHDTNVRIGLAIFFAIGAFGWVTSISEITGCRPYQCSGTLVCARPIDLGLKITTGECTSELPSPASFTCLTQNNTCTKQPLAP